MAADITLLNLNMLFIRYCEQLERELHVPLGCLYLTRALEDTGFEDTGSEDTGSGEAPPEEGEDKGCGCNGGVPAAPWVLLALPIVLRRRVSPG